MLTFVNCLCNNINLKQLLIVNSVIMKKIFCAKAAKVVLVMFFLAGGIVQAQNKKPNILVIWGDDIGIENISFNNRGMMGYQTPNIDRIAKEGIAFTDYYGQQSCTAGRAAFISGSVPVRSGMTKVGLPGAAHTSLRLWTVIKES